MPYTRTVVIHEGGYVVPSAPQEYGRATRPVESGASIERTLVEFNDDGGPVPAGQPSQEIDRYDQPVGADEANRQTIIRERMDAALADLDAVVAAGSSSAQERGLARIVKGLVRLTVPGYLDATD